MKTLTVSDTDYYLDKSKADLYFSCSILRCLISMQSMVIKNRFTGKLLVSLVVQCKYIFPFDTLEINGKRTIEDPHFNIIFRTTSSPTPPLFQRRDDLFKMHKKSAQVPLRLFGALLEACTEELLCFCLNV